MVYLLERTTIMNRKSIIVSLVGLSFFIAGTMTSCSGSSDMNHYDAASDIKLVKTPDIRLYSGNNVLYTSFDVSTKAVVNGNYYIIQNFGGKSDWMQSQYPILYELYDNAPAQTDRGESVSQAEFDTVMSYLAEHPDEGSTKCSLNTYFIQYVGTMNQTYHIMFMDGDVVQSETWLNGSSQMDYMAFNDTYINDYNAYYGPRALCVNIPLVNPYFHDMHSGLKQESHYRFYVIEYDGKKNLYLCFDYATSTYDDGFLEYNGDGVYTDWVVKIIPADGQEIAEPYDEGADPESEEEPDELDFYATDHVEVNLSVNDKHETGDWIHTKLSIHIRAVTDVELFIPVSQDYYCDLDDLNEAIAHSVEVDKRIPQPRTGTFEISNNDTGDIYEISATILFNSNGIRISTQGMTSDLLEYLNTKYGDGLTFEIWNYYNVNAIDRETLKPFLDATTVSFTSDPTMFVNAFAPIGDDEHKNPWDCVVTPPADYSFFAERYPEKYYDYNVLYKK